MSSSTEGTQQNPTDIYLSLPRWQYALYVLQSLAAALLLASTVAIFIWTLLMTTNFYDSRVLSTDFFQWTGASFQNIVVNIGQYRVLITLLIGTFLLGLTSIYKAYAIRIETPGTPVDPNIPKHTSFYSKSVGRAVFIVRWLEELVVGFLVLISIASLVGVTNINLIFTLYLLHLGMVGSLWIFEELIYWYRKYAKRASRNPKDVNHLLTKVFSRVPLILPWFLALLMMIGVWLTLFMFEGYAAQSNQAGVRLAIVVIVPIYCALRPVALLMGSLFRYDMTINAIAEYVSDPNSKSGPTHVGLLHTQWIIKRLNYEFEFGITFLDTAANLMLLWFVAGYLL